MALMTQAQFDEAIAREISEFYANPRAFVQFIYPWGKPGTPLAEYKEPDTWQIDFLEELGDQIRSRGFDGVKAVNPIRMSTSSGHGTGKEQAKSILIDTPSGERRWGDLRPGDLVFGANGTPTEVLQIHEQGVKPIYKVQFDDGSETLVGLDHLWKVRGRQERRNSKDVWQTLSTREILNIGVTRPNGIGRAKQWEIPVQGAAQFGRRDVPLHPYLVGVWLGDGVAGRNRYCKPYPEIAAKIRSLGHEVSILPDGRTNTITAAYWPFGQGRAPQDVLSLFKKGVFLLNSPDRYIPDEYKYNSVDYRRALLEGLLDTDGEVHKSGSIGYSSTSLRLIKDVVWLVRSLGGKAWVQAATKHGWYYNEGRERVPCKDCYRATINLNWNPFTLEHRREKYKPSEPRYMKRWLEGIEYSHDEEAMCISVAANDHLYLTNDFIVTHNSTMSSWLIHFIMSTRPMAKGVVTSGKYEQLKDKTWAELAKWRKLAINGHWFEYRGTKGNLQYYKDSDRENWSVTGQACTKENADSFAGLHNASSTPFFLFDESSAIPDEIYEVAEGGLTDGEPMIFLFGNLTRATGQFAETFGRMRHRWTTRQIDSRTTRMANKDLIAEWIADYGEDSDFVRVRVKGMMPSIGDCQFIPTCVVDEAIKRTVEPGDTDPIVIGVDVARFGDDESVILTRKGRKITEIKRFRELDTMQLSAMVVEAINRNKPHTVFVDGVGIGAGVVDRLRQLSYKPVEVQAGAASVSPDKYVNLRAQMWGSMREWLKTADIPDDRDLLYELTGIEYNYDARMRIAMEKKSDMKRRGMASPNISDALALTFAEVVNPIARRRTDRPKSINWRTL